MKRHKYNVHVCVYKNKPDLYASGGSSSKRTGNRKAITLECVSKTPYRYYYF